MHSGLFICGSAQLSSNAGELVAVAQETRILEPACNSRHARLRQAHRACSAISEEHCASNSAHVLAPARSCQRKRAPPTRRLVQRAMQRAGGPGEDNAAWFAGGRHGCKVGPTKDAQVTHAELMMEAQQHMHGVRSGKARVNSGGDASWSGCTRSSASAHSRFPDMHADADQ